MMERPADSAGKMLIRVAPTIAKEEISNADLTWSFIINPTVLRSHHGPAQPEALPAAP